MCAWTGEVHTSSHPLSRRMVACVCALVAAVTWLPKRLGAVLWGELEVD